VSGDDAERALSEVDHTFEAGLPVSPPQACGFRIETQDQVEVFIPIDMARHAARASSIPGERCRTVRTEAQGAEVDPGEIEGGVPEDRHPHAATSRAERHVEDLDRHVVSGTLFRGLGPFAQEPPSSG